ncbi:hypothetical protein MASR2M12_14060 [Bacteroidales bacterium]
MKTKSLLLALLLWLTATTASVGDIPPPPSPARLVNDLAMILTPQQQQFLESRLVHYNDTTSTQILVVTVNSLGSYDPADFAYRLGQEWGVGNKGNNNGVVILVKPKTESSSGKAFIATGYGLEAVIPDALAKRIVEQEMIPSFKEGDYYQGINRAVDAVMGLASGQYSAEQFDKEADGGFFIFFLIALIVLIIIFFNKGGHDHISSGPSASIWKALWLASMANQNRSGSWGGFSGGSGGFGGGGGFGSGGFGGFGGGSFGGGGAGGSW